jgi:hypothetical protein
VSSTGWLAVAVAGTLAAAVFGLLLTLPIWTPSRRAPRLVALLLAVQAGAVVVGGTVVAAAAARSWQLVDDDPAQQAAGSLIEVSRIDGDGRLYALIVLLVVAVTACAAMVLSMAARFATSTDVLQRSIACAVLGLEIGLCGYGLAQVLSGSRNPLAIIGVVNLPLVMAAMVVCWPPHPTEPRPRRQLAAPRS